MVVPCKYQLGFEIKIFKICYLKLIFNYFEVRVFEVNQPPDVSVDRAFSILKLLQTKK